MTEPVLAVSIGDAADREKLGFPEREVRRVLFAVCTAFIRSGYKIAYAGDLRRGGFTHALFEFLSGTYAGQGIAPFIHIVPASASDELSFGQVLTLVRDTRSVAVIRLVRNGKTFDLMNADGRLLIGAKGPSRTRVTSEEEWQSFLRNHPAGRTSEALTEARQVTSEIAVGCVSMGGKMGLVELPSDHYQGSMPGVAEEALMFLRAGKPYVPLGAYGGATRDIAIALGLLPETERTPRGNHFESYHVAMDQIKALRERVPSALCGVLKAAAREENAEDVAQLAIEIMEKGPIWDGGNEAD